MKLAGHVSVILYCSLHECTASRTATSVVVDCSQAFSVGNEHVSRDCMHTHLHCKTGAGPVPAALSLQTLKRCLRAMAHDSSAPQHWSCLDHFRACCGGRSLSPEPSYDDLRTRLLEDDALSLHSNFGGDSHWPPARAAKHRGLALVMNWIAGQRAKPDTQRVQATTAGPGSSGALKDMTVSDPAALENEEVSLAKEEEAEIRRARRRARRKARRLGLDTVGYGLDEASSSAGTDPPCEARTRSDDGEQALSESQSALSAQATAETSRIFVFSPHLPNSAVKGILYPTFALAQDGSPLFDQSTGEPLFLLDDDGHPIFGPEPPTLEVLAALSRSRSETATGEASSLSILVNRSRRKLIEQAEQSTHQ